MTPFHIIAVPHSDILEGRLTQAVFAAKLGDVSKGDAVDEYGDPAQFFEKTYTTQGLENLLSVVEGRLQGESGDSIIQIQTPFGGGKTHAMIAMYHKINEWGARPVVIDGEDMDPNETLWGELEKQLIGGVDRFKGMASPGRRAIYELLSEKQPVLILMDELLHYAIRASNIPAGDSNLAIQTVTFLQGLTGAVKNLEQTALVLTLPSGARERYGKGAEQHYRPLQHVVGRMKRTYSPVQGREIDQVIRHRLFEPFDIADASEVINEFMVYAHKESILPPGTEPSEYRKRFEASYPFLPDVIDVLHQRWGSYPSFQRTRGVLQLLARVIYSLKDKANPYISLADFDLSVEDIRLVLLDHIGMEYDGVISLDITGDDAGAKKVDDAYQGGFKAGSRTAMTVFMYSFSGRRKKRGATLGEIKRNATTTEHLKTTKYLSSIVGDAIVQLRGKLFHLEHDGERDYFTNEPNLVSILHT
ncbi:ATP-binding protein, partial [Candidatus Poribacteria bacterium]|nr:ATP-binding protein [Candidatus Poribacteria bacterium]